MALSVLHWLFSSSSFLLVLFEQALSIDTHTHYGKNYYYNYTANQHKVKTYVWRIVYIASCVCISYVIGFWFGLHAIAACSQLRMLHCLNRLTVVVEWVGPTKPKSNTNLRSCDKVKEIKDTYYRM